jgi:hypothetical protein
MRIRRVLIIPAIVALGAASSPLIGSAMSAVAVHQVGVHVPASAVHAGPDTLFRT